DRRSRLGRARRQRRRRSWLARLGNRECQTQRPTHRYRGELLDPPREALLDPLQHEAIGRDEAQALSGKLQAQWTDPGIELLLGELALEGFEAALPEGGRRHDRWMAERKKTAGTARGPSRRYSNPLRAPLSTEPKRRITLTRLAAKSSNERLFC